jgi:hypothetical protein
MFNFYGIIEQDIAIKLNDNRQDNYINIERRPPVEFFDKYKELFKDLKEYNYVFDLLSDEVIYNKLEYKNSLDDILCVLDKYREVLSKRPSNDSFNGSYYYTNDFYIMPDVSNNVCRYYLDDMSTILVVLKEVKLISIDKFNSLMKNIESAIIDLKNITNIILPEDSIEIPRSWYITRDGYLYNTMGDDGHKSSNLIYPFNDILNGRTDLNKIKELKERYEQQYNDIKTKGYITSNQFVSYLNWYIRPYSLNRSIIYNKLIVDLTLGIIKAHIEFYDAVDKIPKDELFIDKVNKIYNICNKSLDDFFVRFLGMSKLGVSNQKIICTTNTYEYDFVNYSEKGYTIDLVNPIEVVDGDIEEKDLSYVRTIRRVLK